MITDETAVAEAGVPVGGGVAPFKRVFDPNDVALPPSLKEALAVFFLKYGRFLRTFFPVLRVGGLVTVTRFDDVQEVLRRDDVFRMELAEKHKLVTGGFNFLLGMDEGPEYRRVLTQLMKAFRREDVPAFGRRSAELGQIIVDRARGRLDVVQDLMTLVPRILCEQYYGVVLDDETRAVFPLWTFALSQYLFIDTKNFKPWRRAALAAAERVRAVLDTSIAKAKAAARAGTPPDNIILRLLEMQRTDPNGLSDGEIRASIMGMVQGFIPTNTMAAGHLLEFLMRRDDVKAAAQDAARADDDERLFRILIETSRLAGGIGLGRFRRCAQNTAICVGTQREKRIFKGERVLAGTLSAMFDGRRVKDPLKFNPDRDPNDYMLFGYGLHICLGVLLAKAQITQTLKPLLKKENLRAASGEAGRLTRFGAFPQHLIVEFDP